MTVMSCSRRFPIGLVLQVSACHDSDVVLKTFPIGLVVSVCHDSSVVLKTFPIGLVLQVSVCHD